MSAFAAPVDLDDFGAGVGEFAALVGEFEVAAAEERVGFDGRGVAEFTAHDADSPVVFARAGADFGVPPLEHREFVGGFLGLDLHEVAGLDQRKMQFRGVFRFLLEEGAEPVFGGRHRIGRMRLVACQDNAEADVVPGPLRRGGEAVGGIEIVALETSGGRIGEAAAFEIFFRSPFPEVAHDIVHP